MPVLGTGIQALLRHQNEIRETLSKIIRVVQARLRAAAPSRIAR